MLWICYSEILLESWLYWWNKEIISLSLRNAAGSNLLWPAHTPGLMVNFMCQLDWAQGAKTLGILWGCFGVIVRLKSADKADCTPPICGYAGMLSRFSHVWLCERMDCNPPGFSVHGILQARIWNGLPCPPPGDLPNPGTESESSAAPEVQVDSLPLSNCPYVGGPHPICWWPEQKGWPSSKEERILPAWLPSNWDTGFFLPLDSNWTTGSSWFFILLASSDRDYNIGSFF